MKHALSYVLVSFSMSLAMPLSAQTPAQGKALFLMRCASCHVPPDAPVQATRVGPSLRGVVGRKSGTLATFPRYTRAMKAYGQVWTPAALDRYLNAPQQVVKGTAMSFPGLKKPQERAAVIAYLKANSTR